jgi:Ca2+/Na+ antiporter
MTDIFQALTGNPILLLASIVFIVLIAMAIVKRLIKWVFIIIAIAALFIYYEVQQGKDVDEVIEDVIIKVESVDVKETIEATGEMLEQAKEVVDDAAEAVEEAKEAIESAVE